MIRPTEVMARIDARLARHGKLGAALVKGAVGTAGMHFAHAAIGFVTTIFLAKMLAPAGYGMYSFVMALVALVAIPSELGIPKLAIREIAMTNARKEWGYMRGFIIRSHQAIGALTAILMLAALIALTIGGDRLDSVKRQAMWLGLLVVPLVSLGALRGAMLRGLRKVVLGQLPEQIFRPLVFLALVLCLFLIAGTQGSVVEVMMAQVVASAMAFFGGLYLFLRNRPADIRTAAPHFRTAAWLKSSIPFGLIGAIQLINGRTDVLMLGFFREDEEVGIYRVASQMAVFIVFGLRAVNAI
jgi:O-antigen/teichoic acid export membrane protein